MPLPWLRTTLVLPFGSSFIFWDSIS
jgi:hypothetical protein